MQTICQQFRTKHDINGNPRRLWLEYDAMTGEVKRAVFVQYAGKPQDFPAVELPMVAVSVADLRAMRKRYGATLAN